MATVAQERSSFCRFRRYAGYTIWDMRSVLPWPQAGSERDEEAHWRLPVERANTRERERHPGVGDEAVPVDASARADGVEVLALADDDGAVVVRDVGVVPEGVSFDGRLGGADRDLAAVSDLGLRAEPAVPE